MINIDQSRKAVKFQSKSNKAISIQLQQVKSQAKTEKWKNKLMEELHCLRSKLDQIKQLDRHKNSKQACIPNDSKNQHDIKFQKFKDSMIDIFSASISEIREQFQIKLKKSIRDTKHALQSQLSAQILSVRQWVLSLNIHKESIIPKDQRQPEFIENPPHYQMVSSVMADKGKYELQDDELFFKQSQKQLQTNLIQDRCMKQDKENQSYRRIFPHSSWLSFRSNLMQSICTVTEGNNQKINFCDSFQTFPEEIQQTYKASIDEKEKFNNFESVCYQKSSKISQPNSSGSRIWNCFGKYAQAHANNFQSKFFYYQPQIQEIKVSIDRISQLDIQSHEANLQNTPLNNEIIEQGSRQIRLKTILELLQFFEPNYNASVKMLSRLL